MMFCNQLRATAEKAATEFWGHLFVCALVTMAYFWESWVGILAVPFAFMAGKHWGRFAMATDIEDAINTGVEGDIKKRTVGGNLQ